MDIKKGKNSQFFGEITIKASPPIYSLFYDWMHNFKPFGLGGAMKAGSLTKGATPSSLRYPN